MKRIALFLALIFVFTSIVTACTGDNTDVSYNGENESSSNASSDNTSNDNSSNDTSSNDTSSNTDNTVDIPKHVFTGVKVNENPYATVVSNGASYTKTQPAAEQYEDTYGMELTDSIRSEVVDGYYSDVALSGYIATTNVVVDLGAIYKNLYSFSVGYLSYNESGIREPGPMSIEASVNGKVWTKIGDLVKEETLLGSVRNATYTSPTYIAARYIRFNVVSYSAWIFLDEVMVVADEDGNLASLKYSESVDAAYQSLGVVSKPNTTVDVDRNLDKVLVSKDAKYNIVGNFKNFQDTNGKMLTDGIVSGYYEGGTWVGFDASSDVTVTVDLKKTIDDIALIEACFYTNTGINLMLPVAVKVAAIDENQNRTELGILYGNKIIVNGAYSFALPFDKAISARYIEYTFVATETNLIMVEELGVYSYRDMPNDSFYPELNIVEDASQWGADESDEIINLIKGKTQQITSVSEPIIDDVDKRGKNYYNTPVTSRLMTDGARAVNTDIHGGRFFKFSQGSGRTVVYDLEHVSAVSSMTASFIHRSDWAIRRPNKVVAHVSPDGATWYLAGELVLVPGGTDPENCIYKGELAFDKSVNARYVSFTFDVMTWVGCDELEVFGCKKANGVTPESAGMLETSSFLANKRIEPSDEILDGSKDLCLMYQSQTSHYTAEDLIPYISYVDKDGKPQDLMFDSFLFLYNNTTFPSGGSPHTGSVMSDWTWTIDDLFKDGQNVMALDDAAAQVKSALGLPDDHKVKYTVTLYYPIKFSDGAVVPYNFGDVDGDGSPENTGVLNDRIKIMKWYIDSIEAKVAELNLQNVELVGYYWWHEAIENADHQGKDLLNAISDLVHEVDKEFFWIPYFTANGYNQWAEYGFDVACMQPNYVFKLETPYSHVVRCAELTALYGMGFEMEIDSTALAHKAFYKKYMEYMGSGARFGYMNDTINMYYQSLTVFRDAAESDSTMARNIYDQTYHFIKGDLNHTPDAITGLVFDDVTNNAVYTGTIEFENDLLREFRIESMPEHGTVTINENGTFDYYPEKDFTGEVKFVFSYNEYLGWSDPCEVTLNIK